MAKKKLLQDFMKKQLDQKDVHAVKGGRSYVPTNSGSYGFVNWDDVDIRYPGNIFTKPGSQFSDPNRLSR